MSDRNNYIIENCQKYTKIIKKHNQPGFIKFTVEVYNGLPEDILGADLVDFVTDFNYQISSCYYYLAEETEEGKVYIFRAEYDE